MSQDDHSERRRFSRADFHGQATLHWPEQAFTVQLIDLSLQGALLEAPPGWQGVAGDHGTLRLHLGGDVVIEMQLELAHLEAHRAGFHCRKLDIDSLAHLRRLLELNLQDPDLAHRELVQLLDDTAIAEPDR